jgi:hypothetical protein
MGSVVFGYIGKIVAFLPFDLKSRQLKLQNEVHNTIRLAIF